MPDRDTVMKALEAVIDPELKRSVVELDMVRGVEIEGGRVGVTIALTVPGCPLRASFEQQVDQALAPIEGVETVELSFDVMSPEEKAALTTKLRGGVAERTPGISVDAGTRVVAIVSGKGVSASRRSLRTWRPRSPSSAIGPACSMPTSTAFPSRRCSASPNGLSSSTR